MAKPSSAGRQPEWKSKGVGRRRRKEKCDFKCTLYEDWQNFVTFGPVGLHASTEVALCSWPFYFYNHYDQSTTEPYTTRPVPRHTDHQLWTTSRHSLIKISFLNDLMRKVFFLTLDLTDFILMSCRGYFIRLFNLRCHLHLGPRYMSRGNNEQILKVHCYHWTVLLMTVSDFDFDSFSNLFNPNTLLGCMLNCF